MKLHLCIAAIITSAHVLFSMEAPKNQCNRGVLIAIEGIDGSGKSTLAKHLSEALDKKKFVVGLTKEPGDTSAGKKIRELVHAPITPLDHKTEFLLFAADRAEHFSKVIIPALESNCIIISDRLADSSLAYQGYGRGLSKETINMINTWAMNDIKPDLTIFVKVPVEVALERISKRNENVSVFEKKPFLEDVTKGFEKIYRKHTNSTIFAQFEEKYKKLLIKQSGNCINLTTIDETDFEEQHGNCIDLMTIDGTESEENVAHKTIIAVERWLTHHYNKNS